MEMYHLEKELFQVRSFSLFWTILFLVLNDLWHIKFLFLISSTLRLKIFFRSVQNDNCCEKKVNILWMCIAGENYKIVIPIDVSLCSFPVVCLLLLFVCDVFSADTPPLVFFFLSRFSDWQKKLWQKKKQNQTDKLWEFKSFKKC